MHADSSPDLRPQPLPLDAVLLRKVDNSSLLRESPSGMSIVCVAIVGSLACRTGASRELWVARGKKHYRTSAKRVSGSGANRECGYIAVMFLPHPVASSDAGGGGKDSTLSWPKSPRCPASPCARQLQLLGPASARTLWGRRIHPADVDPLRGGSLLEERLDAYSHLDLSASSRG